MPTLDFAFLADAAEAQPGRKFYVLGGGIESIGAPEFPIIHPHLALVIRVMVHPSEVDRPHTMEIRLMDSDGTELAKLDGQFSAAAGGAVAGREIPMNIVLNFMNTRFEFGGDYSIEIMINNQHMKSLPLRVHIVMGQN